MKILFIGKNHSRGLKDSDPSSLSLVARSQGHSIVMTLGDLPDIIICVDFEKSALSTISIARKIGIPTVLIANEPKVVIPQHSKTFIRKEFDKVIEIGRPNSLPAMKWPQTWVDGGRNLDPERNSLRVQRAVLVNADKWSFIKGQLYWLRAAVISTSHNIDTYGHGWDRPAVVRLAHLVFNLFRAISSFSLPSMGGVRFGLSSPMSYKGTAVDKIEIMSRYKVALVIENSLELMTEKLFDAWFAGCIPVYIGPDLEPFGIPASLLVRCESLVAKDVSKRVSEALEIDHGVYLRDLQVFLADIDTITWAAPFAIQSILEAALEAFKKP